MTHSAPDVLAMMAMGEVGLPESDVRHTHSCSDCLAEMRSLQRVANLARSSRPEQTLVSPSPEVWSRISSTLRLDPAVVPVVPAAHAADAGIPSASVPSASIPSASIPSASDPSASVPSGSVLSGPVPSDSVPSDSVPSGPVPSGPVPSALARRHRARRRRRALPVVAFVLALVAAAAIVTFLVVRLDSPAVIAEARLVGQGGDAADGAAVIEERDGVRDIRIDFDDAGAVTSGDTYREVWLISSDLSRLVSLGTIDGSGGRLAIPDGVDLTEFPVVDVSAEPLDGDPAHSGDSIVRGTLDS